TQHSIQRGALEAVIVTPAGRPLRIYSIHLCHLTPATRLPQVEALLDIYRRAPAEGGAWCGGHPDPAAGWTEGAMPPMPREAVLMGDFNFTPESEEYDRMVGPMSARYGRVNALDGLVDGWVAGGHGEHEGVTSKHGRIDYVFVSASLAARVEQARIDERATGSDHQPLWLELDV
ncbi:MAG: endonuclease/exonuclease/phosphatase family protein, partial [Geminicoccaceae bacterium]